MFAQQLFQRADGAGLVVVVQPGGDGWFGGDPVTVRGLPGTTTPAKEFADTDTSLVLERRRVAHRHVLGADAGRSGRPAGLADVAVRRSDPGLRTAAGGSGFDAAGRVRSPPRTAPEPRCSPAGSGTSTTRRRSCPGRAARSRCARPPGRRAVDRVVEPAADAARRARGQDGGIEAYDPDFGSLTVRLPDGRSVWVDANGTAVSRDELRAIADGVAPVPGAASAELEADVTVRRGRRLSRSWPQAELPSGTVAVRRFEGRGELVCVVPEGGDEVCPDLFSISADPASFGPGRVVEPAGRRRLVGGGGRATARSRPRRCRRSAEASTDSTSPTTWPRSRCDDGVGLPGGH